MKESSLITNESKTPSPTTSGSSLGGAAAQLKASLCGHDYETQVQMLAPEGTGARGSDVHVSAAKGISGSGGALPHKDQIQKSFGGYDISNVQAHTDGFAALGAAEMGADAYATGNHVAFGKGGGGLHTEAHEAAHVVQQRAGVSLSGGVGKVDDPHEKHADAVADLVIEGKSAEGLLGEMAGGGAGGPTVQRRETDGDEKKLANASSDLTPDLAPDLTSDGDSKIDRNGLLREIGDRISVAMIKYHAACESHVVALKSAAKDDANLLLVILDVVTAVLAPAAAASVSRLTQSFAKALGAAEKKSLETAALLISGNASSIVSGSFAASKRGAGVFFEKARGQSESAAFLESLFEGATCAMQELRENLKSKSNQELVVTCAAFDASAVTTAKYRAEIGSLLRSFQTDVEPIGKGLLDQNQSDPSQASGANVSITGLVAIDFGDGGRPVLIRTTQSRHQRSSSNTLKFDGFVRDELGPVAIARAQAAQPRGVNTYAFGEIPIQGLMAPPKLG